MPPTSTPLADRWPLRALHDVRDELLTAWDRPGYHDLRHLTEVLDRLDDLDRAGALFDKVPVILAAWFHDAVYDGQPEAEERSALLASASLPDPPAAEVARLVRMTEHHQAFPDDLNAAALSDADLAILAADPDRYDGYARDVRIEYSFVADADFRAGRAAVLTDLLAGPSLFRTPQGQSLWEERARANVTAEVARLTD
jgi:predicted metal-dependent HD superfamily phosphohydrolase